MIKFLAKIVENSDKTKMTTTNMGICFGVSLLSSSNSLNSSASINNLAAQSNGLNQSTGGGGGALNSNSPSSTLEKMQQNQQNGSGNHNKTIDMNTATNVFDFLLTNHAELFPGEINFLTGQQSYYGNDQKSSFNNSMSAVNKAQELLRSHQSSLRNHYHHQTPVANMSENSSTGFSSNRYSVMFNESSLNNTDLNSSSMSKLNVSNNASNNSMFSPSATSLINTVPSNSVNVINATLAAQQRHAKKNSIDSRLVSDLSVNQSNSNVTIDDANDTEDASSNAYIGSKLTNQVHASSTISLE